jgi:hypothetical protein
MCSAPQLLMLLMQLLAIQGWDVICFSPGAVAAVDGDPTWDVINTPHLALLLLCSSPGAAAAVDVETLL